MAENASSISSPPGSEFDPARWPVTSAPKRDLLTPEELRGFMKIHHGRVLRDAIFFWAAIGALLAVALLWPAWWTWTAAFFGIGILQNGLITWTHEASHCNLHRNKKLNDRLSDFFLCGPAGISVDQYRWHHVNHHKFLGDPEKEVELVAWLCVRGGSLFSEIGKHLLGVSAWRIIQRKRRFSQPDAPHRPPPPRSPAATAGFLLVNGLLFATCALAGYWYAYFVLWVLPLFSVALLISNLRTVVEHQAHTGVCDANVPMPGFTRVVECGWLERTLIAPLGFYYHYEHHLYPSIPYHRLPEVRALLKTRGVYERPEVTVDKGYLRTLWRLAMQPGFGRRVFDPGHAH